MNFRSVARLTIDVELTNFRSVALPTIDVEHADDPIDHTITVW